jgi:hypothetical protein
MRIRSLFSQLIGISTFWMLAGCARESTLLVYPDRVALAALGLPAGLVDLEQWHVQRRGAGWESDWERQRFDGEGRLVEAWQTRQGRPHTHRRYTFDAEGRVTEIDHRVQLGMVGGLQRYLYTGKQVECQHFNAHRRLTRRERLHYDGQGLLLQRQTWLFDNLKAEESTRHMDLVLRRGEDGIIWRTQSVDGRVQSRQAQRGHTSVLVHYDDSGVVTTRLLASARGSFARDIQAGSARYEWQAPSAEGLREHVLHRRADGSMLHTTTTIGAGGEILQEETAGAGVQARRRYLYVRDGAAPWHMKVAMEDGRVVACWGRRLVFDPKIF